MVVLLSENKKSPQETKSLRRVKNIPAVPLKLRPSRHFRLQQVLSFNAGEREKPTGGDLSVFRLGRDKSWTPFHRFSPTTGSLGDVAI